MVDNMWLQVVTGITKATFYISIASILIIVILKEGYLGGRVGFFVLNKNYEVTQVLPTAGHRQQVQQPVHLYDVCSGNKASPRIDMAAAAPCLPRRRRHPLHCVVSLLDVSHGTRRCEPQNVQDCQ
jgi:hypothetical protein